VVRRQNDRKSQIAKKNVKRNLQLEDKQQWVLQRIAGENHANEHHNGSHMKMIRTKSVVRRHSTVIIATNIKPNDAQRNLLLEYVWHWTSSIKQEAFAKWSKLQWNEGTPYFSTKGFVQWNTPGCYWIIYLRALI
jgi:ribosome-binding ATPase YchF (GTP1/OBG family)